jgi:hypothetical protein
MTTYTTYVAYFQALATELGFHFYRKGLDEFLNGLEQVQYPALLLQNYSYRLNDDSTSDNRIKSRNIGFLLIDNAADMGDYLRQDEIYTAMEQAADAIVLRLHADGDYPPVELVQQYTVSSVEAVQVSNFADSNYGLFLSMTISSSLYPTPND